MPRLFQRFADSRRVQVASGVFASLIGVILGFIQVNLGLSIAGALTVTIIMGAAFLAAWRLLLRT